MRSLCLPTLLPTLCLLCLSALSQQTTAVRIGVAVVRSDADKVSVTEARDRLVKALNQHKPDKKWKVAIQAVGLAESQGSNAIAEAKEKNCQFVVYTRLTDLLTSEKFVPNGQAASDYVTVVAAKVEYQLTRISDGAEYAVGLTEGESPSSDREALAQAMANVATKVAGDLKTKGEIPPVTSAPENVATQTAPKTVDVGLIGTDFCKWLPTNLAHSGSPTRTKVAQ